MFVSKRGAVRYDPSASAPGWWRECLRSRLSAPVPARNLREVLIEHARRRATARRGGGQRRIPLDAVVDYFDDQWLDLVAVHEALDRLAGLHELQSQVVAGG